MALTVSGIGFEGYEKRLEISFFKPGIFADPKGNGLQSLSKVQLDEILKPAECTIVSSLSNGEVRLSCPFRIQPFCVPGQIIIKTCGTKKLLLSIPPILELADSLSLIVIRETSEFSIALHANDVGNELGSNARPDVNGYCRLERNYEALGKGGSIVYYSFTRTGGSGSPRSTLHCCWIESQEDEKVEDI
ncbi:S-adenosylmethionine decarboxylase beta chain like [Actinidia chinensis var. chinensis]|uniref:adenosylmethionine decarboxylase n=1 Tax=Actinidia chinensis var. chinensis TaxID=1590841 RepID=A0A2R6RYF3_ACTCC|nr:S-adenosylmethionine decarboxylase beta chain like [Actinidia chinensis var. chinensis]